MEARDAAFFADTFFADTFFAGALLAEVFFVAVFLATFFVVLRALPLRLPLADLSEQLVAVAENLTANDPAALREASERYAADALLARDGRAWHSLG